MLHYLCLATRRCVLAASHGGAVLATSVTKPPSRQTRRAMPQMIIGVQRYVTHEDGAPVVPFLQSGERAVTEDRAPRMSDTVYIAMLTAGGSAAALSRRPRQVANAKERFSAAKGRRSGTGDVGRTHAARESGQHGRRHASAHYRANGRRVMIWLRMGSIRSCMA